MPYNDLLPAQGKKIIIIFINLTGQNRGLSGLKNIWSVIMTGDLLSVILSLEQRKTFICKACKTENIRHCFKMKKKDFSSLYHRKHTIIFHIKVQCNSIFDENILFRGALTKLDSRKCCGMGCMTSTPWNGNYRGVGSLK